jgi:hypothetical protein
MQTRQDFILNTLLGYYKDPSTCAYEGDKCVYQAENGNKCAFGQHIANGQYSYEMEGADADAFLETLTPEAKAQQLDGHQWNTIQGVHDMWAKQYYEKENNTANILAAISKCERYCGVDLSELETIVNA